MIYEEPKVDVIEFAEGNIVTDLSNTPGGDGDGKTPTPEASTQSWW